MESALKKEKIQKRLMEIFKFDEKDLVANKNEVMSVKQKKLMRRYAILSITIFVFVGLFFAGFFLFSSEKPIKETSLVIPLFSIVSFTIIGTFLFGMYWKKYKEGTAIWLNGTVEIQYRSGKRYLCIDNRSILVGEDVDGLFQEGAIYNVYYADFVNHILSVEKAS